MHFIQPANKRFQASQLRALQLTLKRTNERLHIKLLQSCGNVALNCKAQSASQSALLQTQSAPPPCFIIFSTFRSFEICCMKRNIHENGKFFYVPTLSSSSTPQHAAVGSFGSVCQLPYASTKFEIWRWRRKI